MRWSLRLSTVALRACVPLMAQRARAPQIRSAEPKSVSGDFLPRQVPGREPMLYDAKLGVSHSTIPLHSYESKTVGSLRSFYIYTPAGYEKGTNKYPLLYLLH